AAQRAGLPAGRHRGRARRPGGGIGDGARRDGGAQRRRGVRGALRRSCPDARTRAARRRPRL
ncbi:MAG: hypothetical protein AVDCRST_MAG35-1657, partial [uncultured Quadrisphaera sp.]